MKQGERFGRLVALAPASFPYHGRVKLWTFRCDCGAVIERARWSVEAGHTKSCGCLQRELRTVRRVTHGYTGTATYRAYRDMINRCENTKRPSYKNYGGRGITICKRWHKFENFLADMGLAPAGLTLERKDNHKGYRKSNCCWATRSEQAKNRRTSKRITYRGRTLNLIDWAREVGLDQDTLGWRLRAGWSVADALNTPLGGRRRAA